MSSLVFSENYAGLHSTVGSMFHCRSRGHILESQFGHINCVKIDNELFSNSQSCASTDSNLTRVNKFVKLPRFDQLDPCCFSSADVSLDKTVVDNTPIQDVDVRRISKRLKIKHEKNGKS